MNPGFLHMLRQRFSRPRLGIDLGTVNSLVSVVGRGIVLNEPTVVAVSVDDRRVVAIGHEARAMLGRTPEHIMASRPLRDGVIADYAITRALLAYFIDRVCGSSRFLRPDVMICVPVGVTSVERRAVVDATLSAGARNAFLIDEPVAAAIGANVPIGEASGSMIIDIGGGSSEIAVISLGGVVAYNSVRVAGNKIDDAIARYLRRKHNLLVSDRMAELLKIQLGNADDGHVLKEKTTQVRGRDLVEGLPRTITISEVEVNEAMQEPIRAILGGMKKVLETTPPELSSDIIDKGIIMSGGGSLLKNLDVFLTRELGVPCHVAENALMCVAIGTGMAMESMHAYQKSIRRR